MEDIFRGLCALCLSEHVIVDFGLVHQADYYSSIIFRGYIASAGEPSSPAGSMKRCYAISVKTCPPWLCINVDLIAAAFENRLRRAFNNSGRIALCRERRRRAGAPLSK
jgi:ATP phosphoribosyltransferase regulatory subunit